MATKYVFVTGGVVSGLGKGICAASLGRLLKQRGVRVRNQKLVIDLHILVAYGTNISAIVKSITHKVRFTVEGERLVVGEIAK